MWKRSRWLGWGLLAAALAGIAAVSFLWVLLTANAQWKRMGRHIGELEAARAVAPGARPVLRGNPIAGNAWSDYGQALLWAKTTPHPNALRFLAGKATETPAEMQAWAALNLAALDRLREGTRKAEAKPLLNFDGRFTPSIGELDGDYRRSPPEALSTLPLAAAIRARGLFEEGRSAEAIELLLDFCQFGRDTFQDSSWEAERVGVSVLDLMLGELRRALQTKKIGPDGLRQVDCELEILDNNWPSPEKTRRNHVLAFGKGCMQEAELGFPIYEGRRARPLRSWRWGFSSRLRAASTFFRAEAWLSDPSWHVLADWPDYVLVDALDHRYAGFNLPMRSRLRLIRMGVHFQATGEILDLEDPFGDRLKSSMNGDQARFWSFGWGGRNGGGIGDWTDHNKNIVLEIPRDAVREK